MAKMREVVRAIKRIFEGRIVPFAAVSMIVAVCLRGRNGPPAR